MIYFSLCLEWNAVGMLDTSFSVFCEGLGGNSTLQVLDLRNNQINHDGATELAAALKRNGSLRALGRLFFLNFVLVAIVDKRSIKLIVFQICFFVLCL